MRFLCFLLFSLTFSVFTATAVFAEETCAYHEGNSEYCDESWHGLAEFITFLGETERDYQYGSELDDSWISSVKPDVVYIWIQPPDIEWIAVNQAIQNGAKFLVMDETEVSMKWFQEWSHQTVMMNDSPVDPTVAHINGRNELPVLTAEQIQKYTSLLSKDSFQVALNHPTPLIWQQNNEIQRCYAWSWPESGAPGLWVIRDESIVRQLMLNTLDNRRYLHDVMNLLCPGHHCTFRLYEPGFKVNPEAVADNNEAKSEEDWVEQERENITQMIDSKAKQVKDNISNGGSIISTSHWRLLITIALLIWLILIICTAITLKRGSGE